MLTQHHPHGKGYVPVEASTALGLVQGEALRIGPDKDPFGGCGTEATQPNPEALPPEAWPCECNAGEESAVRTGVQWRNPGGGGDEQFRISSQHQGGALETIGVEAHTAFPPALRSRLGVEPNFSAVDNARPSSPKETRPNSQRETRSS